MQRRFLKKLSRDKGNLNNKKMHKDKSSADLKLQHTHTHTQTFPE